MGTRPAPVTDRTVERRPGKVLDMKFWPFNGRSLILKMLLPVMFVAVLVTGAIWIFVPQYVSDTAVAGAVDNAVQTVNQYKKLRGYYTKNIIAKVLNNGGVKPSINHKDEEASIPLPATMIHDISALMRDEDIALSLFSAFPFPNRSQRVLDEFQREAWDFLNKNPDQTFVKEETRDGRQVVRVAVADRMVAEACVNCHNKHSLSPKTDWKLGDVRGVLEVNSVLTAQLARGDSLTNSLLVGGGMCLLVLLAVTAMGARRVSAPLNQMNQTMRELSAGNTDVDIPASNRRDEIGEMASAVQVFKENAINVEKATVDLQSREQEAQDQIERISNSISKFGEVFEAMSRGDLKLRADGEFDESFTRLKVGINAMADKLTEMVTQIHAASSTISTGASEISDGSESLSDRTEQQASTLEETAASMEELTATVKQNADNAQQANQLAVRAREVAVNGGEIVSDTVEAMKQIDESSQKISDIIGVIDEIAFQTNLLALNAAVEAARAGDAGKGFAVVASEVRSLAQRSADSSKEIQALITDSGAQVRNGVELVNKTGGTLEEIVTSIKNVADIVAEIAAASTEQSQGLDEVNSAVTQMDDMTQRNAAMVQQYASSAKSMQEEVARLASLMAFFDTGAEQSHPASVAANGADQTAPRNGAHEASGDPNPVADLVDDAEARLAPIARAGNGADEAWEEF